MRHKFYTADVFTDRIFGGNPLAVLPNAQGLNAQQMQRVAKGFNLSETVFVLPAETSQGTRRLRIFTPATEIPFAGHPTVGTAYILSAIGEIALQGEVTTVIFEEGIGMVPVKIRAEAGKPIYSELTASQLPQFGSESPPIAELASMLSLEISDLLNGEDYPQAVSCGLPFLFIPLRDREALGRVKLNRERWQQLLSNYWTSSVYPFCYDPELEGSDIRARMFDPGFGIQEDPATGSAATALAGYLGTRHPLTDGTLKWVVEQGFEMGRPSILQVEADKENNQIKEIRVGGSSVLVSEGIIEIPELESL
ncbi:MAG: PhzF family phenazine biosynthesis protein [Hydrococcus sp. C42_A2020_068]|uniref:PhzF family phenazine biosynthesis protein n=1 Tax=Pleurocapsa sp. PCC 7327 TaxID=118163 RepID=UPI00029FA000|nr:PhzF family phenazine biosynthesis protein [Pleurocapsa sp. PCC 7327]AFY79571.1 phenazine biosynthesis protein PhzF family [Pleurocapsa sp. PCC 7327]MBF2021145.1 PhzF family phenazine biosynthesis protein [Hydrococcus sp. C42_A2020_068]